MEWSFSVSPRKNDVHQKVTSAHYGGARTHHPTCISLVHTNMLCTALQRQRKALADKTVTDLFSSVLSYLGMGSSSPPLISRLASASYNTKKTTLLGKYTKNMEHCSNEFVRLSSQEQCQNRHLSDMKCTVMMWRSRVRTPAGLKLRCIVLLSKMYLIQKLLITEQSAQVAQSVLFKCAGQLGQSGQQ